MPYADRFRIALWDATYRLKNSTTLWGEQPVPAVEKCAQLLAENACRLVLDVPCGEGRNTSVLHRQLPVVIAADSSLSALALCQKKHKLARLDVSLLQLDIFALPFADGSIPGVFCWDLLGHLENIDIALKEVSRALASGGLFAGSFFADDEPVRELDMVKLDEDAALYRSEYFFRFYSEVDVRELMSSFPFSDFRIEKAIWVEPPHEGYREYWHEHRSWCVPARRCPR